MVFKKGDQGIGVDGRLYEVVNLCKEGTFYLECQVVDPVKGQGAGELYSLCYLDPKDASSPVPVDPKVALKKRLVDLITEHKALADEETRLCKRMVAICDECDTVNAELAKLEAT